MVVLYDDNCTIFDFSHREHPVYLAMCQKPFAVYYKTCQKVYHTLRTASDCRSKRQAFDKLVDNRQKISYTLLWQSIITTFQRHSNRLRSGSISQTVQEVNFAIASLFSLFILFFPCSSTYIENKDKRPPIAANMETNETKESYRHQTPPPSDGAFPAIHSE